MRSIFRRLIYSSFLIIFIAPMGLTYANAQDPAAASTKTSAPPTYRAGKKSFVIPPPTSDLNEIGSDYRVLLETFVPSSNRLIAGFVLQDELPGLLSGEKKSLSRYAMVQVPRQAEFVDVDPENFKTVAASVAEQFNTNLDTATKGQEEDLNRRLKAMNADAAAITFDKPVPLGSLFSKPDAYGFGLMVPVAAKGVTLKVAMGLTVLRVQNRILFIYLYSAYKDEDTVHWLQKTSEQWTDAILAANKQ